MIKFGTGGWRAIIGEDFIKDNVLLVAQAVANIMKSENVTEKGLVVGYDRRFLSERSAIWVSEVMAGNNIPVQIINKISPTPLIMYYAKTRGNHYGMAITASHNPADYNGIKIFTLGGRDATEEVTEKVEAIIATLTKEDVQHMDYDEAKEKGIIKEVNPFNEYIDTILGMLNVEAIREKELKVLVDPMFGVSKNSLQALLISCRCEVDVIHDRHDTTFGGRLPSPSAVTLSRLANMVVEKKYDIGIGTDGDADRLGIIDEKGDYIHPNDIMALLYYYLLKYKGWQGGVVRNIATTHLLDAIAERFGEKCYEVPVGFKHISAKMDETDAVIGGESSGGLTIRGHIKGKDGIFAAGLLVEMMCVTGKRLGEMLDEIHHEFGDFVMTEADCRFSHAKKDELVELLFHEKKLPTFNTPVAKVSYEDGCKVYFENGGWIIARFSGTEPLIRVFAEMSTKAEAEAISKTMLDFLGL
ncbi:phosphoglucomutase/phosphomannomutase family protein [Niameybacter massiliensis]|uniref:Phosphoglucomutase n=1 Tax=Holtiella tumoricola TaxID=3018743 RepID=A0AA42DTR2_9FIRM|nr:MULTISPECIES: phosphoglucomutase/phosphomannomutase family protein [Lachnospirales]MDA3734182.1 phosphoglucomutase/phosphomannomutase family protein [Holtiella tumoricola]